MQAERIVVYFPKQSLHTSKRHRNENARPTPRLVWSCR